VGDLVLDAGPGCARTGSQDYDQLECGKTTIAKTFTPSANGRLLAVVTAIAGMLLSALGGRIARGQRERRTAPTG
jgi:hypothetical protein